MDLELDVHPNYRRYCFKTILEPNLFAKNTWDELRLIIEHLSQQMVYESFFHWKVFFSRFQVLSSSVWAPAFGETSSFGGGIFGWEVFHYFFFNWVDPQTGWFTMKNLGEIDGGILGNLCII